MRNESDETPKREKAEALMEALDLIAASRLVANGEFEEAEALLCRTANPPSSCAALDLLARISVRKGQFDKARQLWQAVLEKDSAHEAAQSALARLGSPWLALAIVKRLGVLSATAIVLALAAVGVWALFSSHHSAESPLSVVLRASSDTRRIAESQSPDLTPHPPPATVNVQTPIALAPITSDRLKAVSRKPPPFFSVPGGTVSTNATETRIVFNEGLFAYRRDFNESASMRLEIAARSVAEHAADCWIIVEGHTDSDPMSPNSIFRDNFDLGLHRALAVAEILRVSTPIPPRDILVASAGDNAPPFPGDDYDTKLRNRTVVIRLLPKAAGAPTAGEDSNEFRH